MSEVRPNAAENQRMATQGSHLKREEPNYALRITNYELTEKPCFTKQ